jgi:hypothetical protein
MNLFCLDFFLNAHDSQVWSFDQVGEFLHISFTGLEFFSIRSSVFLLISFLSSSS